MSDLESRIAALEQGAAFAANQEAIRAREAEFLTTLREMKATIEEENAKNSSNGGSSEELSALKAENARLKAQMNKQKYRISHLVAGMEEFMAAKK